MTDNTKTVFTYLKEHDGEKLTAQDIADATGLGIRVVNGVVTSALIGTRPAGSKNLAVRVPGEVVTDEDGNVKAPKFIQLTDKGRSLSIEEIEAEEIAKAQAKVAAKVKGE